ncbi:MAG TPA: hypothetical protein VG841_05915 [Caulobacterales bacterium]|nr:hypothetical protein [Caulobacterales bacterium]
MTLAELTSRVRAEGRITADVALEARRIVYAGDAVLTRGEAEDLLRLDEAVEDRAPEWTALLLEAFCDHVVRQQQPPGYVDEAGADWLISALSRDGRIKTDSELEILVRVLEIADSAPQRLVTFALEQVKRAVVDGQGPLMRGGSLERGRVSKGEVELLRRILYAGGGDSNIGVTRAEAEILFDINDASRGADNDPSWTDLFSRALAASVMAASGYTPPSRDEAMRRQLWLEAPSGGVGDLLSRTFSSLLAPRRGFATLSDIPPSRMQPYVMQERELDAEPVTQDEAEWLMSRIMRDGKVDAAERELIAFLRREAPDIHPALAPLLEAADATA